MKVKGVNGCRKFGLFFLSHADVFTINSSPHPVVHLHILDFSAFVI